MRVTLFLLRYPGHRSRYYSLHQFLNSYVDKTDRERILLIFYLCRHLNQLNTRTHVSFTTCNALSLIDTQSCDAPCMYSGGSLFKCKTSIHTTCLQSLQYTYLSQLQVIFLSFTVHVIQSPSSLCTFTRLLRSSIFCNSFLDSSSRIISPSSTPSFMYQFRMSSTPC